MRMRVRARDVRLAVLASAVGAALAVPAAFAQQGLDEITVTGTRIRRDDYTSTTATQTITAEDMQRLGLVTAADMLAQLPSNVGTFQLDMGGGEPSSFFVGSTLANLRGMNTALGTRTLVLVDGRRQVQTTNGGGVDLSFVPSILISRMETVTGGASAVYGSDASAGVVNVILDRNVSGLRLDASYGQNKNGDFRNYSVSVASGVNNLLDGKGSLTVSYEHQVTDPVASCGEILEWCARSAASITTSTGSQLYRLNPTTGAEEACGGVNSNFTFQPQCTGVIAPRSRLFPDHNLPHNVFWEDMRLFHEATTYGSLHTPGPRRQDPSRDTMYLIGHNEPEAGTFYRFNAEGNDIEEFQGGIDDFWREYAWTRSANNLRIQGGEGPKYTTGSPTRNGQERDNIFANFRWEVTDDITLNTRLTYGVTEGEQVRNVPRSLQESMCVYLPVRQATLNTTNADPNDDIWFDPNVWALPGDNANPTGDPTVDNNEALRGNFFQVLAIPSDLDAQFPDGTPVPAYFRDMGPMNGFLDPRAPNPISDEMRQLLLDRATVYSTITGFNPPGPAAAPVLENANEIQDANAYSTCGTNTGFYGVFQARPGISIQKNLLDWVDRRVFTDTDQFSFGLSADGPLFRGDRWTWDATLQFGTSDREQIRTDIQRNYRYMMALDSVYDPQANNGLGGVVCRVNASEEVGGGQAREVYRNYILGLSSVDVYLAQIGASVLDEQGDRVSVTVPDTLLQQGQQQVDYLRDGCQPLNPFGQGYITGNAADEQRQRDAIAFAYADQIETSTSDQITASFTLSGEVWKGFGAGPIRMAAGFDYRDNSTTNRNDSVGGDAPVVKTDFGTQYGDPWNGLTEAYEVFTEFELPLIRDRLGARALSVNLTGRRTLNKTERRTAVDEATTFANETTNDYATQRYGTSWRASLNWSVTDWMRIRATRSADIRSPSSRELFSSVTAQTGGFGMTRTQFNFQTFQTEAVVNNPWRDPEGPGGLDGQAQDDYGVIRGSNETLENEQNSTRTLGVVIMPGGRASGLSLSLDYSELLVKGGISYINDFYGTSASEEEERVDGLEQLPYTVYRCYVENDPFWCSKVIFNPTGSSDQPNVDGLDPYTACEASAPCVARTDIVAYENTPFNAEPYWTRNLDISASYNLRLDGGGSLSMRLLATRALEQSRCLQTVLSADGRSSTCQTRQNVVGVTGSGGGTPGFSNFTSQPLWSGNLYASYSKQAFTITGQARYTGKGLQSLSAIGPGHPDFEWNMYNTWYQMELPSWTTWNLTTSYNFARSRFAPERFENLQLSLTIDNLFDKQPDFYSCASCTGGVNTRFFPGNGRTFRLNLRSQF